MANILAKNSTGATVELKATGTGTTGDPFIAEHAVSNLSTLATVAAQTTAQTSLTAIASSTAASATAAAQSTAQTSLTAIAASTAASATAAAQTTAQASLTSIDSKLTAPAVKASIGVTVSQSVAFTGTSAVSAVWNGSTTRVVLVATADCWVLFGAGTPVAAAAAANNIFVPAGVYGYPITITTGQKLAVIQASAAGTLCIVEAA